jgi:hypothetical protein
VIVLEAVGLLFFAFSVFPFANSMSMSIGGKTTFLTIQVTFGLFTSGTKKAFTSGTKKVFASGTQKSVYIWHQKSVYIWHQKKLLHLH